MYTGIPIKNDPTLFMIETGNEIGNIRPDIDSIAVPTQAWHSAVSSFIKGIDRNHFVLDGADESLGQSGDFSVSTYDAYSAHFYGKDYGRLSSGASQAAAVGKPFIVGEYSSTFGQDWFDTIEGIPNMKGSMVWSMFPHANGVQGGDRLQNPDGFTFWYDPVSYSELLLLTNHFRRMRGLPQVGSLSGLIS